MYILTTEMEAINLDLFADATGMNEEPAVMAPVVALYTETLPAQPAAINPFVDELTSHQAAIQAALSELNSMVLNTAEASLRSQVKAIAAGLVNKSGLMDSTKDNYLHMLDAAEANAAMHYGRPVVEAGPVQRDMNTYKRKYGTATEISRHLATASILKEVASLYYVNAELIEQTSWLKTEFNDRKLRLYHPSTAAA